MNSGSSVINVTAYRLEGLVSIIVRGRDFSLCNNTRPTVGPNESLVQSVYRGILPGDKAVGA
jgi:hypothetical protein